ncbi:MAG: BrnT family toxin [Pseudomonadota bacterium]
MRQAWAHKGREIEQAFEQLLAVTKDRLHSDAEHRSIAVTTLPDGRHVFIVFTLRLLDGRLAIRPISARPMREREIEGFLDDKEKTPPPANG